MTKVVTFAVIVTFLITCVPAPSQEASPSPVLIELFTSEGCSSCPPADALLRELSQGKGKNSAPAIVLGEHVDYWNHGGWKDRFSDARFTDRQNAYVEHFHLASPYTPQMVIDGHLQLVGNDRAGVYRSVDTAASGAKPAKVTLQWTADKLHIAVQAPAGSKADVMLAVTEDSLSTAVRNGENEGRTLQHAGVVRRLHVLGKVKDGQYEAALPVSVANDWNPANLKVVVFVQQPGPGPVLGAASVPYQH